MELFLQALNTGGLSEGAKFLNATVDHRFTAIYLMRGSTLAAVGFHDKAGRSEPADLHPDVMGLSLTPFDTAHDGKSPRSVYQYCVPIADAGGVLRGTLCHFDSAPHELPDEEFAFLQLAGKALAPFLPA